MSTHQQAMEIIKRGTEEILLEDDLLSKLKEDKPLRIKAGLWATPFTREVVCSLRCS